MPNEPKHVFYVWFDALTTYMSAVEEGQGESLWPADLHLVGKEILRFHAVYWPAFLMAAKLPLPKRIFAHGWLLFENDKMSKSRGNIVRATPIHKVLGTDALRYFLLREVVFGQDGSFSYDALVGRYNSDLANGLGNLASRTLSMIHQYRGGVIPASEGDQQIAQIAPECTAVALESYEKFDFSKALETIWALIGAVDKYIVEQAPWKLAKAGDDEATRLDEVLYTTAEALRIVTGIDCAGASGVGRKDLDAVWDASAARCESAPRICIGGTCQAGQTLGAVSAVFPRADAKAAIEQMMELEKPKKSRGSRRCWARSRRKRPKPGSGCPPATAGE